MMWKLTARQTICLSGAGAVAAHLLSWVDPVTVHIASNGGSDPSLLLTPNAVVVIIISKYESTGCP